MRIQKEFEGPTKRFLMPYRGLSYPPDKAISSPGAKGNKTPDNSGLGLVYPPKALIPLLSSPAKRPVR